jgi:hypothetical protein
MKKIQPKQPKAIKALSCDVHIEKVQKDGKKQPYLRSLATIFLGPLTVAIGEYGGKVSEKQAMEDFKRNPHNKARFKLADGYNAAKGLGLCG